VSACGGSTHAATRRSDPSSTTTVPAAVVPVAALQRELDALIAAQHAPGAVLGIRVRGGDPVELVSGIEPGTQRRLTATDQFRVASLTKTFTGAEILELVQRGSVKLDDHIAKYVSDWPHGDEITLRELLGHTSGIPPLGGDRGGPDPYADAAFAFTTADLHRRFTPEEVLDFVRDRPLLFAPGSATSYSNINAILLGQVIAKVTGMSVGKAFQRDLLGPLQLRDTHYAAEEPAQPTAGLLQVGTDTVNSSLIDATSDITSSGAAGAMVMNIPDLLTWGEALLRDHTVITGRLADDAFRVAPGGTGLGVIGFTETNGFCMFGDDGCPKGVTFSAVGGTGSGGGTRSIVLYDKKTDTVLALAMNREATPGVEAFAVRAMRLISAGV
jgi:D-alanyl-D-alanine carboxypeptidase